MWSLVVTLVGALCALIPNTQSQALCQDPQGHQGTCISIKKCSTLLNFLRANSQDPEVGNYLRSFSCGFVGTDPQVCCANDNGSTGNDVDRENRQEIIRTEYGPLYPPECGFNNVSQHKFIGGEPAPLGTWPSITILGYTDPRNPNATRWLCGGVLISKRHILTAGHCVYGRNDLYKVRIGDLDINDNNDGAFPFEDFIERRVVHPQYNPTTYTNDIAVLKTTQDVPFTLNLRPICLPVDDYQRNRDLQDTFPIISGWGTIYFREPIFSRLMQIQIPVRPVQECKNAYQNLGTTMIDNDILCAGFEMNSLKSCQRRPELYGLSDPTLCEQARSTEHKLHNNTEYCYTGDSGGPMISFTHIEGKLYQVVVGVLSYGSNCTDPRFPGVYTKVTSFLKFITSQMV